MDLTGGGRMHKGRMEREVEENWWEEIYGGGKKIKRRGKIKQEEGEEVTR